MPDRRLLALLLTANPRLREANLLRILYATASLTTLDYPERSLGGGSALGPLPAKRVRQDFDITKLNRLVCSFAVRSCTLICVQHLVKRFGDFTAVNDISFEVPKGEIFAFLGPNEAGKTTTIKMLTHAAPAH